MLPFEPMEHDGAVWYRCRLRYLTWTDTAARALLGGALVTDVLDGSRYVLLGGQHRSAWHPCPGIDAPDLAFFPTMPTNISSVELMVGLAAAIYR